MIDSTHNKIFLGTNIWKKIKLLVFFAPNPILKLEQKSKKDTLIYG